MGDFFSPVHFFKLFVRYLHAPFSHKSSGRKPTCGAVAGVLDKKGIESAIIPMNE